jgi:hypothetical protein
MFYKLLAPRCARAAAFALAISFASPAAAGTIIDPAGDFLSTYTGPRNGDLDVTGLTVTLNPSGIFRVTTTLAGNVGLTPGAFYVYGVNRGAGTAGFASLGLNNVLFDRVIIVRQDATISAAGVGPAQFSGNTITFDIDGNNALMASTGFTLGQYGWNLWPRAATTSAGVAITGNPAISDFAPNNATIAAVPEPSSWALMLAGLGLTGWAMRRKPRHAHLTA